MSTSNKPKKVLAVAAAGFIAVQSMPALHAENLLAGMSMNGAPNQTMGGSMIPKGPTVVNNNNSNSSNVSVSNPVQVPQVSAGNLAPKVTPPSSPETVPGGNATDKEDNNTGTSPDNPLEEKPTLPDGNGTSGETMGDGVYNPLKVVPIHPTKNPASDNWLTQYVCQQTGVAKPADLTQEDFDKVTEVVITGQNLKEHPKEILNLFNVIKLDLSKNQFVEIPELRNMTKLETLNMSENRLSSINLQADLASVRYVDLSKNELPNANNIGSFIHVQELNISNNRMTNIDDVAECKTMRVLNAANNHIVNINCLKDLNEMDILNLGFNRISDLNPITRAKTLQEIYINNNQLTDLSAIDRNNTNLRILNFSTNRVSSISNLAGCRSLEVLKGDHNHIQDIHPLDDLTNLKELSLDSNQIYDNSTVGRLENLENWSVRDQRIVTEPQKAINGDLDTHNIVISQRNKYLDPNVISDSGRVNRNIISWKNLKSNNRPSYGFGDDQFTGTVDVPINNWENTPCPILGADNVILKQGQYFDALKGVSALDREDGDLKPIMTVSGTVDINTPGEYQLIYRVTDSDGLTSEVKRLVRVVRDYFPVIHNAEDIEIKAGAEFDPMFNVKATDEEDGDLTYKLISNGDFSKNTPGEYQLTYAVTDLDNHTTRVTRNVTIVKNNAPRIVGADDVTIKKGQNFDKKKGVQATDAEDGDLTSVMAVGGNVDVDHEGSYTLTYAVSDRDGNQAKVERTVRVVSDNVPVIENCNKVIIKVGDTFDPRQDVQCWDKEDGNIKARLKITGSVDVNTPGIYELNYTVSDNDGNVTSMDRTIQVLSNEKPVISGASDIVVDINNPFDKMAGVSAFDKEDKDLTEKIEVKGEVDVKHKGTYTLVYSVKDSDDNVTKVTRKVTVVSNKPPVIHAGGGAYSDGGSSAKPGISSGIINLGGGSSNPTGSANPVAPSNPTSPGNPGAPASGLGDITIDEGSNFDAMEGVVVTDDNDASLSVSVAGNVNTAKPGTYTLVYTVSDSDGNVTKVTRKVTVRSNRAPVISWTKDVELRVNEDFDLLHDVTVADDNDQNLISKVVVDGVLDTTRPGTYRITYSVKDSDNNVTKKTRVIIVRDNRAPKIHGVDDIEVQLDEKFDPMFGVTATDDKDKQADLKVTVKGEVDTTVPGEYKLIYSVTDSDGIQTDVMRKVKVVMPKHGAAIGEMPFIAGTTDLVVYLGDYFDPMQGVTANDRQDGDLTKSIKIIGNNVNTNCPGIGIVIYEVTDSDGHTVRATRAVEVVARPDGQIPGRICTVCHKPVCVCVPKAPCSTSGCIPQSGACGKGLPKTGAVSAAPVAGISTAIAAVASFLGLRKRK